MTRWMLAVVLVLGLAGLAMLPGRAAAAEKKKVKLKLEDCPKAVQETLKKESEGVPIKKVQQKTKNGKVIYEVDLIIKGEAIDIKVAEDGTLIRKGPEEDPGEAPKKDEPKDTK